MHLHLTTSSFIQHEDLLHAKPYAGCWDSILMILTPNSNMAGAGQVASHSTKQFSNTISWVSYNQTPFWQHLPGGSGRFHRARAQSHKTAPHFRGQSQVQVSLCFQPSACKSEVSMTPSLGSVTLLDVSHNSGILFTHWITHLLQKILKNRNQQPDEEIHSVRSGTKELLCLRGVWYPAQWNMEVYWFTNLGALGTQLFGIFMEASVGRIDSVIGHQRWIQPPALSSPQNSGGSTENSNHAIL